MGSRGRQALTEKYSRALSCADWEHLLSGLVQAAAQAERAVPKAQIAR
jgi:hypothetical protein